MEPPSTPSASSAAASAPPQPSPASATQSLPVNFIPSPPKLAESFVQNSASVAASQSRHSSNVNGNPGSTSSTPRLRSSIACARCRRSKIKCTNAGAGTTCEACAHSSRECIYPAPGTVGQGSIKREGDGEDAANGTKRTRVRKTDTYPERVNIDYAIKHVGSDFVRSRLAPQSAELHVSSQKTGPWQPPALTSRVWGEIFELFQLHYGTELPFLHAPTFLPRLAEDPAIFAAMVPNSSSSHQDPLTLHLLQLGLLTLTARLHDQLIEQHSPVLARNIGASRAILAASASESYAITLRGLLFGGLASLEQPSVAKIQALLMLALYEWSIRKGSSAWIHLGLAIRVAQAMDLFSEDVDITGFTSNQTNLTPTAFAIPSVRKVLTEETHDPDSLEAFVEQESSRRTVWSCFILDRLFSNSTSRPTSIQIKDIRVQLPCGEKSWTFGDRVCTPFFDGTCSKHRERMRRKVERLRKKEERRAGGNDMNTSGLRSMSRALEDNYSSRIPCEFDQEEGLISRFVKLTDIWSTIARWSYQGGKR
jgi:hypothetical protein